MRKRSIQETIEDALQRIFHKRIRLIGSGRTDSGVHAQAQVANFKINTKMSPLQIQKALNSLLPEDVVIITADEVSLDFHARFSAKGKWYCYRILNRPYPSALDRLYSYFVPYPLNLSLMKREAAILLGRHNFKAFQASDKRERPSIRTIKKLEIKKRKNSIDIDIIADGFLYNMVRNIVGTLVDIGRGRFPEGSMKRILKSKDRALAGETAPARGLCLMEVYY